MLVVSRKQNRWKGMMHLRIVERHLVFLLFFFCFCFFGSFFGRRSGSDGGRQRRRRAQLAPGRGAGVRTSALLPVAGRLLQRQQAARLHVRQGARDAARPRLERLAHADAHHRPVPRRPAPPPLEDAGHAHDRQVPPALGPTR